MQSNDIVYPKSKMFDGPPVYRPWSIAQTKLTAPPVYKPQTLTIISAPTIYRVPSTTVTQRKHIPVSNDHIGQIRTGMQSDSSVCRNQHLPPQPTHLTTQIAPIQRASIPFRPAPLAASKAQSIKWAPIPPRIVANAVQPFSVIKLSPDDYGKSKSRFAAHYRKLASNTTVNNEKAAAVLTSSNVATFKLVRRKIWEEIAKGTTAFTGSTEDNWRAAKKNVMTNKYTDIRFVTLPSDPSLASTTLLNTKKVKSTTGHSERRIFSFIKEKLILLGVKWPEDWVIEWVYTERAPCQTRNSYSSGYDQGCSDLMSLIESHQQADLRVYYSFGSKKDDPHQRSAKTRITTALKGLSALPELAKNKSVFSQRQQQIIGAMASVYALDIQLNKLRETIKSQYKPGVIGATTGSGLERANKVRYRWLKLLEKTEEKKIHGRDQATGFNIVDGDYEDKRLFAREILLWFATDGLNGTEAFVETFNKTCDHLESQLF